MSEQFLPFQSFSDIELAKLLSEKLSDNKIEPQLEKAAHILDSNILGTSSSPDFTIKLRSEDFIRAHQSLEEYYKKQIDDIEPDYYLFDFSNDELKEIIAKPDEWNPLDYQLSQKILADRGVFIDSNKIQTLKAERKKELSKPEKPGSIFIIIGYFFCFTGLVAILTILTGGEKNYFPTSLLLSVFFGHHLINYKKTLPDGQLVYSYGESDRWHGRVIFYSSLFFLFFIIGAWLFITS
jgi:hypothetical protein